MDIPSLSRLGSRTSDNDPLDQQPKTTPYVHILQTCCPTFPPQLTTHDIPSAQIPWNLGKISLTPCHYSEYISLLKALPASKRCELPKQRPQARSIQRRYPQLYRHRVHCRTPGVVRGGRDRSSRLSPVKALRPFHHSRMSTYREIDLSFTEIHKLIRPKFRPVSDELKVKFNNGDEYSGTWCEDKKHGQGLYKYKLLKCQYSGEWSADERHGTGEMTFKNKDKIIAEWADNKLEHGAGTILYANGQVYEGGIQECMRSRSGKMVYHKGTYVGEWLNDMRDGTGVIEGKEFLFEGTFTKDTTNGPGVLVFFKAIRCLRDTSPVPLSYPLQELLYSLSDFAHFNISQLSSNDVIYLSLTRTTFQKHAEAPTDLQVSDGEFHGGKLTGAGLAVYGSYGLYFGSFIEGRRSGWGRMKYTNTKGVCSWMNESKGEFSGQWINDQRQGIGEMRWADGTCYKGHFNQDSRDQTEGTVWFSIGDTYTGGWSNNLMQGYGVLTQSNGTIYKGQFSKGVPAEKGTLIFKDGRCYEGRIVDYEPHGPGKMFGPKGTNQEGVWNKGILI